MFNTEVLKSRSGLSSTELLEISSPFGLDREVYPLLIVGMRGYYLDSLGQEGINDRGIYDDALFIDSPNGTVCYHANTDPSAFRKGWGTDKSKGMARLKPGLWKVHQFGMHKNYEALVQIKGEVSVIRDGDPDYEDTGYFGINIHKGSYNGTSSSGCQTIYPEQWQSFIGLAKSEAVRLFGLRWNNVVIPYLLVE